MGETNAGYLGSRFLLIFGLSLSARCSKLVAYIRLLDADGLARVDDVLYVCICMAAFCESSKETPSRESAYCVRIGPFNLPDFTSVTGWGFAVRVPLTPTFVHDTPSVSSVGQRWRGSSRRSPWGTAGQGQGCTPRVR